ncbi:MAG: hypothetical protein ACT4QC_22565 [Planctomycetaceae bacterium]
MPWYDFIWSYDPGGNVEHIVEHGLTPEDIEAVVCDPIETSTSRATGRPIATGFTSDGRLIVVVYDHVDEMTIYPITAFEVEQ